MEKLIGQLTRNELLAIRNKIKYHVFIRSRILEYIEKEDTNYVFIVENDKVLEDLRSIHLFKCDEGYMYENKTIRLAKSFFDYLIVSKETYKRLLRPETDADLLTERELEYFYKTNSRIIAFNEKSTNEKDFKIDFNFYKGKTNED